MIRKFFMAAVAAVCFSQSWSQVASVPVNPADSTLRAPEEEKKEPVLSITGSVDAYYRNDLADVKTNSYTSFTPLHNSFALGMASIKFEHKGNKVSAVADLGFGPRARDFAYTDDGITQAIKQAYVSYAPADWVKFTLGTWATHVGYELLDPQLNRNYTMSYMFTNGPFSHTGFKAEFSKEKHGFMIGIANATDFRIPPDGFINKKTFLAQYSFLPSDNLKFYLNFAGGQNPDTSKTNQFDIVVTGKVSEKFNIGFNGTLNSTRVWDGAKNLDGKAWWGSALYLNFDPKAWWGLTLRTELFSDKNQFKTFAAATEGGQIFGTTLSANFKTGGFIFIPEFRLDNSNKKVLFTDNKGALTKTASSFIIAAVYSF